MLVVFRGLPGTGKSFLVRHLVERQPRFLVVSRDAIRRAVIPRPSYCDEEKALVDELVATMTGFLLGRGKDVVIDGMSLSLAAGVERLVQEATSRRVPARIVECVCRQETALARIASDAGGHPAGDRDEELYFRVKARFQPVARPVLTVDTDRPLEETLATVIDYLDVIPGESA